MAYIAILFNILLTFTLENATQSCLLMWTLKNQPNEQFASFLFFFYRALVLYDPENRIFVLVQEARFYKFYGSHFTRELQVNHDLHFPFVKIF